MMEYSPDGNLEHYQQRVLDKQNELVGIAYQLEVHREIGALMQHPSWPKFVSKLEGVRTAEIARLLRGKHDAYNLGKTQGRIAVLDSLLATQPLSQEEVDTLVRKADTIRSEIQDLQQILT
jgi:hypothetical protein